MKLKQLGANQTLLIFENGDELLFSYETPVAGRNERGFFRTKQKFSNTTSKHINSYLEGALDVLHVNQEAIELTLREP